MDFLLLITAVTFIVISCILDIIKNIREFRRQGKELSSLELFTDSLKILNKDRATQKDKSLQDFSDILYLRNQMEEIFENMKGLRENMEELLQDLRKHSCSCKAQEQTPKGEVGEIQEPNPLENIKWGEKATECRSQEDLLEDILDSAHEHIVAVLHGQDLRGKKVKIEVTLE